MTPDWHAALAYALTGERLDVRPSTVPYTAALLAELDELGWAGERLIGAARTVRSVPPELMAGLGAAQLWALLAQLRGEIGASRAVVRAPSRRTTLSPEERRLDADRPPHW